jgi:hypothetical protein
VVTVVLTLIGLTQGVIPGLVIFGVLVAYHLLEGHTLRPLIYGRALKLSPLVVIIAILLGTELAGILAPCSPCLWRAPSRSPSLSSCGSGTIAGELRPCPRDDRPCATRPPTVALPSAVLRTARSEEFRAVAGRRRCRWDLCLLANSN